MRVSSSGNVSPVALIGIVVASLTTTVSAQDLRRQVDRPEENDHAIVLELGAAGDWSHAEGFHPGGTFAFEVTPIEHWLELEVGVTAIRGAGGTQRSIDVLCKKPWRFSPTFEFMVGVGPELVQQTGPDRGTFWGVSSVVDFMFWPRKRVGWYVEPAYEATFQRGQTHHGLGMAAGLLIGY